ncbi:polysaccharide deacetylase family protein [Sphaerisporangium dianthi]|uniref:Polysaccharide deacetylase family protein n=1 Tax=Sphaerisporangium dianthi TaxID=1436120 RepID=A0ABV9CMZ2_9ACTN
MTLSASRRAASLLVVALTAAVLAVVTACGGTVPGHGNDAGTTTSPGGQGGASAGHGRTVVSLTFDDAWATQTVAADLLRAHHLVGTFYINSGFLGRPKRLTRTQVEALARAGNEIGGHTLTHPRLPTLSRAAQRHQICDDRRALLAMGFRPRSFAYPYGMYDRTTIAVVRGCGYDSARRSGGLAGPADRCTQCLRAEDVRATGPYELRTTPAVRRSMTLDALTSYVRQARERGGGLVAFQFHNVCDGCDEWGVRPDVLDGFFGWLEAQGVTVRRFGDVVGGSLRPMPRAAARGMAVSAGA